MALIYAVLETHYEYLAEHQFFYNRIQHVVMHHLGPMLLALAWPGETLMKGMPAWLRGVIEHRAVARHRARAAAAGAGDAAVRRLVLPLADPSGALPGDDRRPPVYADELDHGGRRHPVLVPCARSAPVAAGTARLHPACGARRAGDVPADRRGALIAFTSPRPLCVLQHLRPHLSGPRARISTR